MEWHHRGCSGTILLGNDCKLLVVIFQAFAHKRKSHYHYFRDVKRVVFVTVPSRIAVVCYSVFLSRHVMIRACRDCVFKENEGKRYDLAISVWTHSIVSTCDIFIPRSQFNSTSYVTCIHVTNIWMFRLNYIFIVPVFVTVTFEVFKLLRDSKPSINSFV